MSFLKQKLYTDFPIHRVCIFMQPQEVNSQTHVSSHTKVKILITIFLFLGIRSSAQELEGYYGVVRKEPRVGPKESFHFRNDSSFRYQAHSAGQILIGEGVFRTQNDSLVLYFGDCRTCRFEPDTVLSRSAAPKSWIYVRKQMPWGIDVWGIQNEVMVFAIRKEKKAQVIFTDKNAVTTYRRMTGKGAKQSFDRYFID